MARWFSSVEIVFLLTFALLSVSAQEATSFATLNIDFGPGTTGVWCRYLVRDGSTVRTGWLNHQNVDSNNAVARLLPNNTSHVRGILYASGCAIETFDVAIRELRNYRYSFPCTPIPQIEIRGSIPNLRKLYDDDVRIEAKYFPEGAAHFFEYDDGASLEIPLGGFAKLDAQNHFRLSIPDLSLDKRTDSLIRAGEVRLFVRSVRTGQIVDGWRLNSQDQKLRTTRFGGIPVDLIKTESGTFSFCPARSVLAHDQFGFALRPELDSSCLP